VNYTPLLPRLQQYREESHNLLRQARVVLCLGDRALLCLLTAQAMESATVLAAVTTAEECRQAVQQHRPTLVLLSDQLERGNAITLVEEIKSQQSQIHVLLMVSQRAHRRAVERAIKAHCDGVVLQSRLGTGTMAAALRAVSGGGAYVDSSLRMAAAPWSRSRSGSARCCSGRPWGRATRRSAGACFSPRTR
jgi:DNA-binding NarL/FixJ family response regulator